ncbi:MAG: oxidative damage protection protein [Ardenticatenaceae bacterium]|nr:oxidative damage protection protein [Ardenticatenaceae bacterium]
MPRETKTLTVVFCSRYQQELPALAHQPFPGPLGERIFDNVSQLAFTDWLSYQSTLINHYGLNLADPRANDFLFEQMKAFFFNEGQGMEIGGAPAGKGGGPARK